MTVAEVQVKAFAPHAVQADVPADGVDKKYPAAHAEIAVVDPTT
jgi:hypothetical protein